MNRQIKTVAKAVAKKSPVLNRGMRAVVERRRVKNFEAIKLSEKVNPKTIVFSSFMGRGYNDSPRAIYLQMIKSEKFSDFQFVWAFKKEKISEMNYVDELNRARLVAYGSREHLAALARAKYVVSNSRLIEGINLRKKEQIYLQTWHGTPLKRLGADIVGNNNAMRSKKQMAELYKKEAKKFSALISPSEFTDEMFLSAFSKTVGKVLVPCGYPKNDVLVKAAKSQRFSDKRMKEIRAELKIPEDKKVILYMPTWRDDQHDSKMGYVYQPELDFEKMKKKFGKKCVLLYRSHYFVTNKIDFSEYGGFVKDVSDYDEVSDLYLASDVLMTDYSSAFFDYALLDRPIVFYMYDKTEYRDEARGFYLTESELPGQVATDFEELSILISDALKMSKAKIQKTRKKFHERFNAREDGRASEKIIRKVIK